jgi:C-terminal processing protease CtpA/Prc
MNERYKRTALGVLAAVALSAFAIQSVHAAALVWQEKEIEEKEGKRIRIAKSPCVFISSSKKRGMLGVDLTTLNEALREHFGVPRDAGIMVNGVTPDGPADKAGVKVGDVITSIDGEEVSGFMSLARKIRRKSEGDVVELEIYRDKSPLTLTATIEERKRSEVEMSNFFMEDCDEFEFDYDFDEEAIREAIDNATRHIRSPEFKNQFKWVEEWSDEEFNEKFEKELEKKLKELEKKLEKMEKELEELEKKKKKFEDGA